MRLLAAALLIGGCGRIGFATEPPPGPADSAADALDPAGDLDGDGILNATDLCPDRPDPLQDDEDADGRGDVCDRCPAHAAPADPDRDLDGVGDACDPDPETPGDRIVLFEGFEHGEPGPNPELGAHSVNTCCTRWAFPADLPLGGRAQLTLGAASDVDYLLWSVASSRVLTISTGVVIDSAFDTTDQGAGPTQQFTPLTNDGVKCSLGTIVTGTSEVAVVHTLNSSQTKLGGGATAPSGAGARATLALRRGSTTYTCAHRELGFADVGTHAGTGPSIGLHSRGSSVSFTWVMIVESP